MTDQKAPKEIKVHRKSKTLELMYNEHERFVLSCEYLRVYSPSAEVKGHGPGQEVLQTGKKNVSITNIIAAGNYAIQIFFSDEHDTGIYTWDYLYDLCINHDERWKHYLNRLDTEGGSRDPDVQAIRIGN